MRFYNIPGIPSLRANHSPTRPAASSSSPPPTTTTTITVAASMVQEHPHMRLRLLHDSTYSAQNPSVTISQSPLSSLVFSNTIPRSNYSTLTLPYQTSISMAFVDHRINSELRVLRSVPPLNPPARAGTWEGLCSTENEICI